MSLFNIEEKLLSLLNIDSKSKTLKEDLEQYKYLWNANPIFWFNVLSVDIEVLKKLSLITSYYNIMKNLEIPDFNMDIMNYAFNNNMNEQYILLFIIDSNNNNKIVYSAFRLLVENNKIDMIRQLIPIINKNYLLIKGLEEILQIIRSKKNLSISLICELLKISNRNYWDSYYYNEIEILVEYIINNDSESIIKNDMKNFGNILQLDINDFNDGTTEKFIFKYLPKLINKIDDDDNIIVKIIEYFWDYNKGIYQNKIVKCIGSNEIKVYELFKKHGTKYIIYTEKFVTLVMEYGYQYLINRMYLEGILSDDNILDYLHNVNDNTHMVEVCDCLLKLTKNLQLKMFLILYSKIAIVDNKIGKLDKSENNDESEDCSDN
jgi:hypothetical protein